MNQIRVSPTSTSVSIPIEPHSAAVTKASLPPLSHLHGHTAGPAYEGWQTLRSWREFGDERQIADMADKREVVSRKVQREHWDARDQSLISATLMATPTQRLAWLEEALRLAYTTGALKPRRF